MPVRSRERLPTGGYLLYDLTPDGTALLVNTHGKAGHLALFDPATRGLRRFPFLDCLAGALSPDGSWLAVSDYVAPPRLVLWRLPQEKHEHEREVMLPATGTSLIFEAEGASLLVFTEAGVFRMRLPEGELGAPMRPGTSLRSPLADPSGRYLAAVNGAYVELLNPETLAEFMRLPLPMDSGPSAMAQLATDASGDVLVAHLPLGAVVRWDLRKLATELRALGMDRGDLPWLASPSRH